MNDEKFKFYVFEKGIFFDLRLSATIMVSSLRK
jgi:hypothetical protein